MIKRTPWGEAEDVFEMAPGIDFYSTESHGGIHLDRKLSGKMPDYMHKHADDGCWYEEDAAWSLVALVFPYAFTPGNLSKARATARNWYPDEYMQFTGEAVTADESYMLRRRAQVKGAS